MDPIKTEAANFVYRGPRPDIADLWVQRVPEDAPRLQAREIRSVWELTDEERRVIAEGGRIELALYYTEPIPPVSLAVLYEEQSRPVGDHDFRVADEDLPKRPVADAPQA